MALFDGLTYFNEPLTYWDSSMAGNMYLMFRNAKAFNQDLVRRALILLVQITDAIASHDL
jgi:Mycoplasma protein of unknown function, DUF285